MMILVESPDVDYRERLRLIQKPIALTQFTPLIMKLAMDGKTSMDDILTRHRHKRPNWA